ncbi:MAG: hypothetical protein D6689_08850 [Deltaproteobacteria bacterium]|nr:MAG: hypothetical protein D6689_08850 [Deltaproteobacteria bacterium]
MAHEREAEAAGTSPSRKRARSRRGPISLLRAGTSSILFSTLICAPLAIGGVHEGVRLALFVACAVGLFLLLAERRAAHKPFPVTVPLLALGVAVAATALHLVPLPRGLLALLSPQAAATLDATLDSWRAHAITLDPPATWHELAKLGAYLAFFAVASTYASRTYRRRRLIVAVAGVTTLVAVIGLLQAVAGTNKILFFYTPEQEWAALVRGTFVNPNHFGALMCLGAPCALVVGLRERRSRAWAFAATAVINVAGVLSLSRGALVGLVVGQALAFLLDRRQAKMRAVRPSRGTAWALGLAVVCGVGAALAVAGEKVGPQIEALPGQIARNETKADVWAAALPLVANYPITGVGRGAFEQAFTRVSELAGRHRYPWIENIYLQTVVDWGVPIALVLCALAAWGLRLAVRRLANEPLAPGALAGLAALAVHEAVDFAIEIPGVAFPALAVLAVVFGHRLTDDVRGRHRAHARKVSFVVPVALLGASTIAFARPLADEDGARVRAIARDFGQPVERVLTTARAAASRHPASYFIFAVTAERLATEGHPETMRWLNRAIFLNPSYAPAHILAARVLARTGRKSQALLEYRLALRYAFYKRPVLEEIARIYPGIEDLVSATPHDARHLAMLGKWLRSKRRMADADRAYRELLSIAPTDVTALRSLVQLALQRRDAAAARRWVARLREQDRSPAAGRLEVRVHLLSGDASAAVRALDGLDHTAETFALEIDVATALARSGNLDQARRLLDRATQLYQPGPKDLARIHLARAEIEARAGNPHQANWERQTARRLTGQ